jgi:hypothetical protein
MSHKKKPEDSHKVRDDKKEKARKEHEVAANVAETIVIGEAGNERDRVANLVPEIKAIKEVAEFLVSLVEIQKEIAESIPTPAEVLVEGHLDDHDSGAEQVALTTEEVQEEALRRDACNRTAARHRGNRPRRSGPRP